MITYHSSECFSIFCLLISIFGLSFLKILKLTLPFFCFCLACSPKLKHSKSLGTNNLPALQFHSVHGYNIKLTTEGIHARRTESFCEGLVFSNRPVRVNERVCIKFTETVTNWGGALRFGFTSHDPVKFRNCLPKYACPDLSNKPGNWVKALYEQYCNAESMLSFYVNENGQVYICVNGEDKGIFISGINVDRPLWAVLDVYGNTTAIQLIGKMFY